VTEGATDDSVERAPCRDGAKAERLKEARKASDKAYKESKADRARKLMLVGEAVLRRVERGELDEAEFRQMMDEALMRPADRALFDLD
jgi:hypothetical protein